MVTGRLKQQEGWQARGVIANLVIEDTDAREGTTHSLVVVAEGVVGARVVQRGLASLL